MKKISLKLITAIALISTMGFYSCHTTKKTNKTAVVKKDSTSTATSTNTTVSAVGYTALAKNIISENCSVCHRGMTSYEGVKWCVDNGQFKKLVIENRSMPKGKTLSEADYTTLKAWIDAGGKE